ncbi:glutamine--fructose-6-phosphate aminotransferase, partial [bacterium]|nr:glutamine--fructose-6-phosphate aminotransferase [bacterium]
MCGIIGYIGFRKAVPVIIEGLNKLEYRGYDSSGIAVLEGGALKRFRAEGKINKLEKKICKKNLSGNIALGHTRWATH